MGKRGKQEGKPGAFLSFPGWRVVEGHEHHMGYPFTFHVSHEDVSICPLVNPMLEGAAFEHNLRGASCHQAAISLSDTVLLTWPAEVLLHCGIRDVVGRTINQVQRNYPVWKVTDNVSMVSSPSSSSKDSPWSATLAFNFPIFLLFVGVHCHWDTPSPTGNLPTIPCNALPGHQASGVAAYHLLRHCSKIRDGSCLSSKDLAVLTAGVLDFTFLEVQTEESITCPILHQCLPETSANCFPVLMVKG